MADKFHFERLEQIVALAQKITETRDHLDLLISEWNQKFPEIAIEDRVPPIAGEPPPPAYQPAPVGSIDDRIVNHLDDNAGRDFNANMLHDELGVPPSSLGTQLSKLYRMNRIGRSGRGFYHSVNRVKFTSFFAHKEEEVPEGTS